MLYYIILYKMSTILHYIIDIVCHTRLYYTIVYCAVLCAMLVYIILYFSILYDVILYCIVLYCIVLYYIIVMCNEVVMRLWWRVAFSKTWNVNV